MQEKHQKHADIDDPLSMHGAAGTAEMGEYIRQKCRQQHPAQKPVGEHSFEMFEHRHSGHRDIVRNDDLA